MFIDKAKITIKSGDGGNGTVSFLRLKCAPNGGPDGGNGGNGGSIIFEADGSKNTLSDFYYKKKFSAEAGERGQGKKCDGRAGKDLVIKVPEGTVIRDFETGKIIADMFKSGERVTVLAGGRGGRGNANFCTARRQSPSFCQQGEKTDVRTVLLELKTIADVGLVGFPNAGKSTLLSVISQARPKIANYPFTTLSPNLGVVRHKGTSFLAADIPGLIEGASEGTGLGHEFLRHIERTRMIIHVIDMSGGDGRDPLSDYIIINKELEKYGDDLASLAQIVMANKMDIPGAEENLKAFKQSIPKNVKVIAASAVTLMGIGQLLDAVIEKLKDLPKAEPLRFEPFVYSKADNTVFEIIKDDDGVYEITGGVVETLSKNITLDDIDSFNYFQKQLKTRGIIDKLYEAGAKHGDTVIMGDIEFEFIE